LDELLTVNRYLLARFLSFGEAMKEPANGSMPADVAALRERARRALKEAQRLAEDQQFISSWCKMRPRSKVRLSSILDE
jgi:hypothetical protein